MAHESFEDDETARMMNALFVNVKVDREERPDLDGIYMQAVQAMTGHGGWPMTVFLTPSGEPFYGGTYYPPEDRHGMPSFKRILTSVSDAWTNKRDALVRTTSAVQEIYARAAAPAHSSGKVTVQTLEGACRSLASQYDSRHHGFGGAPKFPPTMALDFLLRYWKRMRAGNALEMAANTFKAMARGGIYDQVGGGFHRYAVDAQWLVPHFEKMLYDNALLVRFGTHLWQATKDAEVRRITEETLNWLTLEMTSLEGGFHSSLDADSEGHEGKFYVWTLAEIESIPGADAAIARTAWGVTSEGNFEGKNILFRPLDDRMVALRLNIEEREVQPALDRAKVYLYATRAARVWPARDGKIVASWNGLMLRGVAEAARAFGGAHLRELAIRNGEYLLRSLVREDGRVWRLPPTEVRSVGGFLEDHAAVALGFLDLYQLTFDRRWLDAAQRITVAMNAAFWDAGNGVFYDTANDAERLITRPRDTTDNAMPSGNSLAVELLLKLGDLLHDADLQRQGAWVLETQAEGLSRYAQAFGHLLGAADMAVHGAVEVALVGEPNRDNFMALAKVVGATYVPSLVLAGGSRYSADDVALLADREMVDGKATAHVCRGHACELPTTDAAELALQLETAGSAGGADPSLRSG